MTVEVVEEAPLAVVRHGVLYEPCLYPDVKDPSLVFDGRRWHLFGTGCGVARGAEVLHSTALEVRVLLKLGGQDTRGRARLHGKHRFGGNPGHDQRVGVLVVAERPGPVGIEV